jgi:hypothetical protein
MSAAPEQLPAERLEGESKESSPDASTQALDEEAAAPRALPHFGTAIALWIIALVALIGALHLAQTFFVPLLFGILVSNALSPVVGWLECCRVPRVLGAGLVLVALIGGVSWVTLSLSDDAGFIVEKLPEAAHKLRHSLRTFRAEGPTVLEQVEKAAKELEKAAVDAGLKSPEAAVVITNQMEGGAWIKDFLLKQSTLLVSFAAQMPVVLLLTYFLLAAGTHFRRKLIKLVGPSLTRKKDAVRILALPACLDHIEYFDRCAHLVGIRIVWVGTCRSMGGCCRDIAFCSLSRDDGYTASKWHSRLATIWFPSTCARNSGDDSSHFRLHWNAVRYMVTGKIRAGE